MSEGDFCLLLTSLKLTRAQQGVALLWHLDREREGAERTPGEVARRLRDAGRCSPHSAKLGEAMVATGHVHEHGRERRARIKPAAREAVGSRVSSVVDVVPEADRERSYIPAAVRRDTRGHVESLASQLNGCFEFRFYDGASVLLRRLVETLLIEACEAEGVDQQIRRQGGDDMMLSKIIGVIENQRPISSGRDSRKCLVKLKEVGDHAAHNRRYVVTKADLEKVRSGARLVVDELLHLARSK